MARWNDGRRLRRALLPLACLLAALTAVALAAGCGSSDESRPPPRRVVAVQHVERDRWSYARARFKETCAGCHTLKDAGAFGKRFNLDVDPNIDEARARFAIAEGEPGMPSWAGVLSKREYEELVDYVVAVSGNGRGNDDYWGWQIALRSEGERWNPEDGREAPAIRGRTDE
jgi:mono/diheme cytochrome c family protein